MLKTISISFLMLFAFVNTSFAVNTIYFDRSYTPSNEILNYSVEDAKALLNQSNVIVADKLDKTVTGILCFLFDINKETFETLYQANTKETQAFYD